MKGAYITKNSLRRMYILFLAPGDAFNGGLVAGLAEGMDIWQAARFASAVAGVSVTRYGTAPSMPTREEAEALLSQGQI